jgi:hypothetical protein
MITSDASVQSRSLITYRGFGMVRIKGTKEGREGGDLGCSRVSKPQPEASEEAMLEVVTIIGEWVALV